MVNNITKRPGESSSQGTPGAAAKKPSGGQVQVKFITSLDNYRLPETIIYLPTHLRRYGLSEVVNHLLALEKPVPFDFLIQGEFIKSSLAHFMNQRDLSTESVIEVEYIESTLPPTPLASYKHDDWVSSVKISDDKLILTGSYDHHVRVWDQASQCLATLSHHKGAVHAVNWVSSDSGVRILSASQDQSIIGWQQDNDGSYEPLYVAKGHTKPVLAVQVAPSLSQFASSSADGMVKVWSIASIEEDPDNVLFDPLEAMRISNKKHKGNDAQKLYKGALLTLDGHFGPVHGLAYDSLDSTRLFSGGHDHALRVWDVTTATNILTKTCEKPFLALSHSTNLLASGHTDSLIRIWDPRTSESSVVKLSLAGHSNWVSSVEWQGSNQHRLISASYDGTLRVWDLRSKTSQFTLLHSDSVELPKYDPRTVSADHPTFQNKVLALGINGQLMASGGQDCHLKLHKVPAESS
ncbi:ribosome biogenesis protein ytm1 [Entomophthora muscae]|uniref:Ribosome biogenesis protein ytm1 n=1 Tax=Entomophthora muscae TaxID=34485 RepID=A0ACC2TU12_9FUNG|nr:ribosome biogenesis protein ytm1 [Entomophthora muscae]